MEVKKAGFRTHVQTGIVLIVNNNVSINVNLQVGAVSDRIEVTGNFSRTARQAELNCICGSPLECA